MEWKADRNVGRIVFVHLLTCVWACVHAYMPMVGAMKYK